MKTTSKSTKVVDIKSSNVAEIELTILEMITEFHPSISHLGSLEVKDIDALIAISKASKVAKQQMEEYDEIRVKISESECLKDENGKPIIENNRYKYADKQKESEVIDSVTKLQRKKIKINVNVINISSLKEVNGLTANTISGLREMIIM
jgi:hypothetical protein